MTTTKRARNLKERPIPQAATRDPNALEIIRVWIAEKGLHTSIRVGVYKDSGINELRAWGIILADVTRHLADAINECEGLDRSIVVEGVVDNMLDELRQPTSKTEGSFTN
jgi:hypothetical protein